MTEGRDYTVLGLGNTLTLLILGPHPQGCLPGDGLGCGQHRNELGAVSHLLLDLQAGGNVHSHFCQSHLGDERRKQNWAGHDPRQQEQRMTSKSRDPSLLL